MTRAGVGARLLWVIAIATLAAIIAGVLVMGSPAQQRDQRLDDARTADLSTLQIAIRAYWREHQQLPQSLAVVAAQPGVNLPLRDPVDASGYGYRVIDATHFELCAQFATDSSEHARRRFSAAADWPHPRGRHCFRRAIKDRD